MLRLESDSEEVARIDKALSEWRQGDVAADINWFVHVGNPAKALSEAASESTDTGIQALTSETRGLAILTQTCDIVRSCVSRPYIEVAPIVAVGDGDMRDVQRGRRPSLAALPFLIADGLVVDLDRVMTVEKSVAADWTRTAGWTQDADARRFAQALARKRARTAFPDDFTMFVKKLSSRLAGKHDKESDEGRALRSLREIRIQATPTWDAPSLTILFWFIREENHPDFEGRNWADLLESWLALVPDSGRFVADGLVVTLEGLSGVDYVSSDRLDLDHLSTAEVHSSGFGD